MSRLSCISLPAGRPQLKLLLLCTLWCCGLLVNLALDNCVRCSIPLHVSCSSITGMHAWYCYDIMLNCCTGATSKLDEALQQNWLPTEEHGSLDAAKIKRWLTIR